MSITTQFISAVEAGRVPDSMTRKGIRYLLGERIKMQQRHNCEQQQEQFEEFVHEACQSAIAEVPEKANEQHYEVPASFFQTVLGPRLKYSSCYWPEGVQTLEAAEQAALQETVQHAELSNGLNILELGCGWGSLTLFMAEQYPQSNILAVSNSQQQREFILKQAEKRGLNNLDVQTADMNDFDTERQFDRVVSVEMFEHMRNHRLLMQRIYNWLKPGGKLFVHIFCQRDVAYLYEDRGPKDWMTRHFFAGGMMPSDHLLLRYQDHLKLELQWCWNGQHYEKTCNAWLANQDRSAEQILEQFQEIYGPTDARKWFQRWRVFFMACAELFAYREGNQWWVSHYLFKRPVDNS